MSLEEPKAKVPSSDRELGEVLLEVYLELGWIEEMPGAFRGYRLTPRGKYEFKRMGMNARGKSF